jgi:pimeloyl-ACP methyl ester carboxylesterase
MRTDANGATLYHEQHGAGEPLVLIHGGLATSAMWEPLLPGLVDRFRVITPDSRGHGRSTNPAGTLSYTQLAGDVAALIAALGLERPVVGGYSDGGQIALELGARHPGAAGALIVGAAYPTTPRRDCAMPAGPSPAPTMPASRISSGSTSTSASSPTSSSHGTRAGASSGGRSCAKPRRCGSTMKD